MEFEVHWAMFGQDRSSISSTSAASPRGSSSARQRGSRGTTAPWSSTEPALPEIRERRCPCCKDDRLVPAGHVIGVAGMIKSERWANLQDVLALAKYPNVEMKATGAPSYSDQPYPFRDIHDQLRQLYDAFGPARWFWGTDITRMPCPWRQCVTLFTEELPWLRGRDLELVMGRAVCDWIGWKR
jgi:hypothetical protein